ncbi:MAG TPA: cell wall-binding repeat-containing protein [Solirubrobacterales bacterium]
MAWKRPINAGIPASDASPRPPRRPRKPIPAALKAVAGLVIVAIVFLVAAVLGGGSSDKSSNQAAPAPAPPAAANEQRETPAAAAAEELGYPSFATNNTTRVGGSDPATTAAGVALAVFPSTTPAQRPAAVALVDEADWQGAIAASVLMSAPLRVPLLVSSGDGFPDPTSQALEVLDPQGSSDSGGAQAFAVGSAPAPEGLKTTQVKGKGAEPATLAAAVAALRDKLFGSPPQHIVLASEDESAFAMPAAAWAARSGDPVLFTGAKKLPAATLTALKRHPKVPVYVLGPSSAISTGVLREVAKVDKQVRRVSGKSPVENAIALARHASGGFGWNVNDPGHGFVVARSDSPLDAAVAAPLSASGTWGPLLLTENADTLPKALREYLLDVKPGYTTDPTRAFYNHVWVIGDQEAIDVNQQADINQLAELAKVGGEE